MRKMSEMPYHTGMKVKLHLSDRQKHLVAVNDGVRRAVYNHLVACGNERYRLKKTAALVPVEKNRLAYLDSVTGAVKNIKNAMPFLYGQEVDEQAIANAVKNYKGAWKNCRELHTGVPVFKKKSYEQSYQTNAHYYPGASSLSDSERSRKLKVPEFPLFFYICFFTFLPIRKRGRSNTMKKNLLTVIAIIACVLLAFNTIKTISLQEELDRLRSDMNDEIHTVNRNIDNIYGDVTAMLEAEANQLAVSEWRYGDFSIDDRTAEIICTVVPKVYTPGTTQATIVCNGQEYPLIYVNEQFTATIELSLFDRNELNMVKLNDHGTIRTQELDWIIEPRYEVLLISHADMSGCARQVNQFQKLHPELITFLELPLRTMPILSIA